MMNLRIYGFLLLTFILHLEVNLVRSTNEWKGGNQDSKGRRLSNVGCLLLIKEIHYKTHDSTELDCLFARDQFPKKLKNVPKWLKKKLENEEISSNKDFLQLTEVSVSNTEVYIPSGALGTIMKQPTKRRYLTSSTGNKSLVAMKINVNGQQAISYTPAHLSDSIFGTNGDVLNLSSGYDDCSYSKLTFSPGTGQDITNGVLDVTLNNVINRDFQIYQAALAEYGWGFSSNQPPYDYVSNKAKIMGVTNLENILILHNLTNRSWLVSQMTR